MTDSRGVGRTLDGYPTAAFLSLLIPAIVLAKEGSDESLDDYQQGEGKGTPLPVPLD